MKILSGWAIGALGALAMTGAAAAQTVGIGTTRGGATNQVATAIASVVSAKGGIQMRPQPYATTALYLPVVDTGRLEFGVSNIVEALYGVSGTGMSEGQPKKNLRLVAVLFPFEASLMVDAKSGMKTMADLKGRKMPQFPPKSLGEFIMRGFYANGGFGAEDVKGVPTPNFPRMWESLKDGSTEAAIATVGSRPTFEAKASLGDIVFLSLDPAPAKIEAMRKFLPQAYAARVKANPKLPGIQAERIVMAYDYVLWAHKDVKDDVVTKVIAALHDNPADLRASGPIWKAFDSKVMGKQVGMDWHPAAVRYLKAKGVWQGDK